jgi:hypothetical protein
MGAGLVSCWRLSALQPSFGLAGLEHRVLWPASLSRIAFLLSTSPVYLSLNAVLC